MDNFVDTINRKFHVIRARNEPPTIRELFRNEVLYLFTRGMDTDQISEILKERECLVERALHEALNPRRKERTV